MQEMWLRPSNSLEDKETELALLFEEALRKFIVVPHVVLDGEIREGNANRQ